MPQQQKISTENNFIAGLKTDFTALNFPENAATDTDNCVYDFEGDVTRRFGFDPETNYDTLSIADADIGPVMHYRWLNAGGDGNTQIDVVQIGATLHFYRGSDATVTSPLSTTILVDTISLVDFAAPGATVTDHGCQFAHGNGFLFVFSEAVNPFYCTYDSNGNIAATQIDVKIRDFKGLEDNLEIKDRPLTLTDLHKYNLENQGWANKPYWTATVVDGSDPGVGYDPQSFTGNGHRGFGPTVGVDHTWNIGTTLAQEGEILEFTYSVQINAYDIDAVEWFNISEHGSGRACVTAVSGSTITAKVTYVNPYIYAPNWELDFPISPITYVIKVAASETAIETFKNEVGVYPSNTDVWFLYKEVERIDTPTGDVAAEKFAPGHTVGIIQQPISRAPQGHFIFDAFNLDRETASGITGLTTFTTDKRPRTGAWFQGRVWFAGVDASHDAEAELPFYTWTENIYFSQIIEDNGGEQFGKCYQFDDPTDENNFNLLPTDGGVITIQGSGSIYKLFSMQNGLLVFAANGIWFITGSSGIGFNAADYTITKISSVRSISGTSYVDVNGVPFFWNEEAIYAVQPAQQGSGLVVDPITAHSISRYYENIPYETKKVAKGSYDPINYVVQWVFNSGEVPLTGGVAANGQTEGDYQFFIFDDCCHLYKTTDGVSYTEGITPDATDPRVIPDGTGFDSWTDMTWSCNDGDFELVGWDDGFIGSFGLIGVCTPASGGLTNEDWTLINPRPDIFSFPTWPTYPDDPVYGNIPDNFAKYQGFSSGATTAGQEIILTGSDFWNGITAYPRLSLDGGATWSDVTGLPSDQIYTRVAFSANADVMYIHRRNFGVYKSTDKGTTWTFLASSPAYDSGGGVMPGGAASLNSLRMLCSADGQTVCMIDWFSRFNISTDGGTTWTEINFTQDKLGGITPGDCIGADFSMTPDGTKILVGGDMRGDFTEVFKPNLWLSTDGGTTWTQLRDNLKLYQTLPITTVFNDWGIVNVGISADGSGMIVTYDHYSTPAGFGYADISTDGGTTWKTWTFALNTLTGGPAGFYVWAGVIPPLRVYDPTVALSGAAGDGTNVDYTNVLNYNTLTKAWYPWTISTDSTHPSIYDVKYVQNPGGEGAPDGIFKYVTSIPEDGANTLFTFSECSNADYLDWNYAADGLDYESYFLTGFKLHGQAIRKWQPEYIQLYSRNDVDTKYHVQGVFNFSNDPTSGRWSNKQRITIAGKTKYGMWTNKIRIRGSGLVTQLRVSSVDDNPFDIMGWSMMENQNPNV